MKLAWTPTAAQELDKLPKAIGERITAKMEWYASQDHPLSFAKHLTQPALGTYRFRIGNYRIFCDIEESEIRILLVLTIRKRDHAYDDL